MYTSTEYDGQEERIEDFLFQLFASGALALEDVRRESLRLGLPLSLRHRLMTRCVDALYDPDAFDDAA